MGYYLARVFLFFFFFLWIINFVFPMVFLLYPSSMCLHWDQPPRGVKGTNRSHVLFLSFLFILNLKEPRFPNGQIYCYFPLSFSSAQIATPGFTHLMAQFPWMFYLFFFLLLSLFSIIPKKSFPFKLCRSSLYFHFWRLPGIFISSRLLVPLFSCIQFHS